MDMVVNTKYGKYEVVEDIGYLTVENQETGKDQRVEITDIPYELWVLYGTGKVEESMEKMVEEKVIRV